MAETERFNADSTQVSHISTRRQTCRYKLDGMLVGLDFYVFGTFEYGWRYPSAEIIDVL